jgi:hypothetical protein
MEEPPNGAVQEGDLTSSSNREILTAALGLTEAVCSFFRSHIPSEDNMSCDEYLEDNQIMSPKVVRLYLPTKSVASKAITTSRLVVDFCPKLETSLTNAVKSNLGAG